MPQVDLISVCAGHPKVACETTLTSTTTTTTTVDNDEDNDSTTYEEESQEFSCPDYAPESFWLSKDSELDWLDRNAFLERNGSIKGSNNSNPVHVYVGSQRYAVNLKTKTSFLVLPKPQKKNYAEVKNRRHLRPPSLRIPKLAEPGEGKPSVGIYEPRSPKVSCTGRVRSRKERSQRGKKGKEVSEPGLVRVKSVKVKERKKSGFWKNIRSIFRSKGDKLERKKGSKQKESVDVVNRSSSSKKRKCLNSSHIKNNNILSGSSNGSPIETPGLGAIKKFASSRKSDAWAGDLEFNCAISEPLDRIRGPIWQRREVGAPMDISVDHDWHTKGPMSV